VDGKRLARTAVRIVVKMIFEDGFFHADPHPGNIIIMGPIEAPVIGLIDVGMVGRLSPELRVKTVRLMVAAARKDSVAVADALYSIGRPTRKVDMMEFRAEVALLAEKFIGLPLRDIQLSTLIRDLVDAAVRFGLEIPSDFMMVGKALMTLEGIGRELDPDLDIFEEAKPHFLALLRKRLDPVELGNEAWRGVETIAGIAHDVPLHVREVLDDLRMGRLEIRTAETQIGPSLDRLGRRLFSGFVIASLNVAAGGAFRSGVDRVGVPRVGRRHSNMVVEGQETRAFRQVVGGHVFGLQGARWRNWHRGVSPSCGIRATPAQRRRLVVGHRLEIAQSRGAIALFDGDSGARQRKAPRAGIARAGREKRVGFFEDVPRRRRSSAGGRGCARRRLARKSPPDSAAGTTEMCPARRPCRRPSCEGAPPRRARLRHFCRPSSQRPRIDIARP
jgi:hypothetical protein